MRVDPLQVLTKLAAAQNIPTRRVTPPFDGLEEFDYGLRRSLDPQFDWQEFGRLLLEQTPAQTLLFVEGTFELHFALFRIPDEENTDLWPPQREGPQVGPPLPGRGRRECRAGILQRRQAAAGK